MLRIGGAPTATSRVLSAFVVQVGIEQATRFDLASGHQVAVTVERDRDRRVAKVGAQSLGVQPGGDPDTGESVAALMEAEPFESRILPAHVGAAAEDAGVGLATLGCWHSERSGRL